MPLPVLRPSCCFPSRLFYFETNIVCRSLQLFGFLFLVKHYIALSTVSALCSPPQLVGGTRPQCRATQPGAFSVSCPVIAHTPAPVYFVAVQVLLSAQTLMRSPSMLPSDRPSQPQRRVELKARESSEVSRLAQAASALPWVGSVDVVCRCLHACTSCHAVQTSRVFITHMPAYA